jgi:hypothetical protein
MSVDRSTASASRASQEQLLQRIAARYEQLAEQLDALEAKLRDSQLGVMTELDTADYQSRKPR